jgi:hypothetical protein
MVENLQFAAVAAYLLWCLCASLTGVLHTEGDGVKPDVRQSDKNAPVR